MKSSSIKKLRKLLESEVEQAESIIAARGFSQELQSMLEKLGRLLNEDLPAVAEQMRHSLGADTATAFENQTTAVIQGVMDQLRSGKQSVDNSVAAIGEGQPISDMPAMGDDFGDELDDELGDELLDIEGDEEPEGEADLDIDLDIEDEEESPLGRARKESVEYRKNKIKESAEENFKKGDHIRVKDNVEKWGGKGGTITHAYHLSRDDEQVGKEFLVQLTDLDGEVAFRPFELQLDEAIEDKRPESDARDSYDHARGILKGKRPESDARDSYDHARGILKGKRVEEDEFGNTEYPYVCFHTKKGEFECDAKTTYEAAKKAAEHWGLKSTSGIDVRRSDIVHTATESAESKHHEDMAMYSRAYKKARSRGDKTFKVGDKTYKIVGDVEDLEEMDRMCEKFLGKLDEDELERRAQLKKQAGDQPLLKAYPDYKEKDKYGDGYKIKGPRGKLPESEEVDHNEFYDYVLKFYGDGGLYDISATREEVEKATDIVKNDSTLEFEGDSIDRERVRDVIVDQLRG